MRVAAIGGLLLLLAGWAGAQEAAPAAPQAPRTPVVVLDRDALYGQSLFGQRITRDVDAALRALAAENRRIEAELEAEEQALTDRRPDMDPDAFRDLARDFDERVTEIRRTQDDKERAIAQQSERAQAVFFEEANPILIELVRELGALVILDRRVVIASSEQVDITRQARERIDARLGEGDILQDGPDRRPDPVAPGDIPTD
ncbi:MAG: OmpH family outer membrane protein [Pseudomonadota bacterium]